ncbi:MAG: hypothetical protein CVU55_05725 [Deltaproteobacteria bacterium HGW-Deltaproteobacteria-13]|jgi:hypothetical protein|nr:MAG: hypothetical protein CVU55_05725 [Deltaproteobacteria bacterium HGW-Deltaproteobacteria-13]
MADMNLQLKAIDALVGIYTAIKNARPDNPAITNSIETLYLHLLEALRQQAPLIFAELEKKELSRENNLNQRGDNTIPVSSLLDILLALDIKNISFDQDLEKKELHILVNLLAENPETLQVENKPAKEDRTAHVEPDNKGYITLEKEQEIVSEPDIAEDNISESVAGLEKVFNRMNALEGALESIPSEEKMEMIRKSSMQAARWVEKEEACTPEYKELCQRLETLLQEFINYGFFAEAASIINVFSKINDGALIKDDHVREVSSKVLRNLASDNNFNILFKEINDNGRNKQNEACQIFAGFGNVVIDKLLDGLRKATDSKARISIIHIIEEMGPAAIPAIKASIDMNAPWYYLRNMAYVLGRIGNEKNVDILKPLLLHQEKRVRKEAFKSIVQTGGKMRGSFFLSVLPHVDKELRINIVEMLGKIKCTEAVTDLQFMLKSKHDTMAKNDQVSLQEEICNALGAIGSPEAVKTLSEIAESKSILGIGSYPKEVKYAAERALAYIRRK